MSVTFETRSIKGAVASLCERRLRRGSIRHRGKRIQIALVNNMPDSALAATQRQFGSLLEESAGDLDVQLSLWTLETLERGAETLQDIAMTYRPARELRASRQDAVIITGAEPRASDLRDEPYWSELTELIDWAENRTVSTLLSCLAAHAAVRHWDGIGRRRLATKCSGVFATHVVARHELTEGFGPGAATPHSRFNGLDECELSAKGYLTLTRSAEAGVDMFAKDSRSLLVFLQGHPEYDADTLAREYRRDALRFLRGERPAPPMPPAHYFTPELAARLRAYVDQAPMDSSSVFPSEALRVTAAPWRATSIKMFRNWLALVARRKAALKKPSFATARWSG